MSWAFSPLLSGAAHQQSDPFACTASEAATASTAQDATLISRNPQRSYRCCGLSSAFYKTIDAYVFASDTTVAVGVSWPNRHLFPAGMFDKSGGAGYLSYGNDISWNNSSAIEKLSFSTETISVLSNAEAAFSENRNSGLQSGLAGYVGGGYVATQVNTLRKLLFSTDVSSTPSATLAAARQGACAVESSDKGYWLGGATYPGDVYTPSSEIDAIIFASDTANNPAATLSVGRGTAGGVNSSTAGYTLGGYNSSEVLETSVDKLLFSNDTRSTIGAAISGDPQGGSFESSAAGYVGDTNFADWPQTVRKLAFTGETFSAISTSAAPVRYSDCCVTSFEYDLSPRVFEPAAASAGTAQGPTTYSGSGAGYFCTVNASGTIPWVEKIAFASDTISVTSTVPRPSAFCAALQTTDTGYLFGGVTNDNTTFFILDASAFQFSTETIRLISDCIKVCEPDACGVNAQNKGVISGFNIGGGYSEEFLFSTEVSSPIAFALSSDQYGAAPMWSSTKGYWAGGAIYGGSNTNAISGIVFSSNTLQSPSATLSAARMAGAGVSSLTTGYVLGGSTTDIDGLIFSSETATNPSASMPAAIPDANAVQSATNGYVSNGDGVGVTKFSLSAETTSTTAATLTYPWFYGPGSVSQIPSGTAYSDSQAESLSASAAHDANAFKWYVDEFLATLSATAGQDSNLLAGIVPRGYFVSPDVGMRRLRLESETVSAMGIASDKSYPSVATGSTLAYIAGGVQTGNADASVDSFEYASESITLNAAALTTGRRATFAFGDSTYGYIAGGTSNGAGLTPTLSSIERIVIATGTTSVMGATLSAGATHGMSLSSSTKGYAVSTAVGLCNSFTYSTEATATVGMSGVTGEGGASSATHGYVFGFNTSNKTDKLDFSGETWSSVDEYIPNVTTGHSPRATAQTALYAYTFDSGYAGTALSRFTFPTESRAPANGQLESSPSTVGDFGFSTYQPSSQFAMYAGSNYGPGALAIDTPVGTAAQSTAISESATSSDAPITAVVGYSVSMTDAASADDTKSVLGLLVAAHAADVTASDSPICVAVFLVSGAEPATALDDLLGGVVTSVDRTEQASPDDALSAFVDANAEHSAGATATDSMLSAAGFVGVVSETVDSDTAQLVIAAFSAAINETAGPSDSPSALRTAFASSDETVSAIDVPVFVATYPVEAIGDATASDSASSDGTTTHNVTLVEVGSAASVEIAVADFISSATETGGSSDSASASVLVEVQFSAASGATESADTSAFFIVSAVELAIPGDVHSAERSTLAMAQEAAAAVATFMAQLAGAENIKRISVRFLSKVLEVTHFSAGVATVVTTEARKSVVSSKQNSVRSTTKEVDVESLEINPSVRSGNK